MAVCISPPLLFNTWFCDANRPDINTRRVIATLNTLFDAEVTLRPVCEFSL